MDLGELLARYELLGEERDFVAAKSLYERAIAEGEDARLLNDYGFLLESHARSELRRAAALYERAIERDPGYDKPHFQLISARAGLQEPELAVAVYERRLAEAPDSVREHRFLAQAYLAAHAYARTLGLTQAGLALAPDDPVLTAARGEAKAGLGDVKGALSDWQRALRLDPEDIGALYSSAFLLEREGRLDESVQAWRAILAWNAVRGLALESEWPKQELDRLQRLAARSS